jgi:hypothetical protein
VSKPEPPPKPEFKLPGRFSAYLAEMESGEKPFPKSDAKRHHFLPKFVLNGFCDGRTLFQLDKEDGSCVEITPKQAAWEADLYTVESTTGEHDGLIEGFFGLAETFSAPALRSLLGGRDRLDAERITDGQRADLAYLIAIQEQRVPGFIAEHETRISEMATMLTTVELANVKGKKRALAQEAYAGLISGELSLGPSQGHLMQFVLMGMAHTCSIVYQLPWTLLEATTEPFVCSDRPITMRDPNPKFPWSGAAWLSSEDAISYVPLSARACLRLCHRDGALTSFRSKETAKQPAKINFQTYGWATRYVYGSSVEQLVALHERALADPDSVPKPTKKRQVITEDAEEADPAIAAANVARGWPPYIGYQEEDGTIKRLSYEVIDSVDDVRRSMAPQIAKLKWSGGNSA